MTSPLPQILGDWRGLPASCRGGSVALGNFDGVHRGHAALVRAAHAARPDLPLAALTFEPHPREIFRADDPPFRLTLPERRARLLGGLGVRLIYQLGFTQAFAHLSPEAFVHEVLHEGLGASHVVCGPDFAFGHRRGGTTDFLAAECERLGIGLTLLPPVGDGAGPYSSSRARRALLDGYPEQAAHVLGRPHVMTGIVAHGDARGRTIGFPTANTELGRQIEPARGVYAVRVTLEDGSSHDGVANLGRRPTMGDRLAPRLETHIFDFNGDLYGQSIEVALIAFLREERKFPDFAALRAQIAADAEAARRHLAAPVRP